MKRLRLPLVHPLAEVFFRAVQSVTTSMSDSSKGHYRTTTEYFLRYLGEHHPGIRALDQLRRDPHILGWLATRTGVTERPCMERRSGNRTPTCLTETLPGATYTAMYHAVYRQLADEKVGRAECDNLCRLA